MATGGDRPEGEGPGGGGTPAGGHGRGYGPPGPPGRPEPQPGAAAPQAWSAPGPQGPGQYSAPGYQAPGYGAPESGPPGWGGTGGPVGYGRPPMGVPGDTEVVGRRVVQYLIDGILSSLIPLLAWLLLIPLAFTPAEPDGSVRYPLLALISVAVVLLLWAAIYIGYWVVWPAKSGGQTIGMRLLGVRVVRSDTGAQPSMAQHFVRWILLIVDGICAGLVGLVIMLVSDRRQRLGDMAAGTLVVRA